MMPTGMSVASCDAKHYVAPHFNCLYLINVVVPILVPFTSCDAKTSANVTTCSDHLD